MAKKTYKVELTKSEMKRIMRAICYMDMNTGETDTSVKAFNKVSDAYSKANGWKEG